MKGMLFCAGGFLLLATTIGAGPADLVRVEQAEQTVQLKQASLSSPEPATEIPKVDFTDWSEIRIKAYGESLSANFPQPMAVVDIPRLRMRAPLYDGVDDLTLDRGLGHVPGTALPEQEGNLAIAGHRDSFFRVLKDIHEGDVIDVTTSGNTATYTVEHTIVVDPTDVEVLKPRSKSALTLVTCYPFYFVGHAPKRFIVEAVLTQRTSLQAQQPKSEPVKQ